ncbi:MAG: prephenate dehydrogenase/arogenate dehydrogenase family protein [Armatimonadetes bacterium]|nr:prephenate dehydrogenase/arogenate dehydrogenase family protein [Armatimonadota bacterium]
MSEQGFFERVTLLGVGLMGGSLGLALREKGLAREIIGYDPSQANLDTALSRNLIDTAMTDLHRAAASASLIVFAAPVSTIPPLMEAVASSVPHNALLTDLGSTKREITVQGERLFGSRFVGGHPMAGAEESGASAARPNLFQNATWILTSSTPRLGAKPVAMTVEEHDIAVGLVSHLPHLMSFAFAGTVRGTLGLERAGQVSAGSYRDMMRVSVSAPALWADILYTNREALLVVAEKYEANLNTLRKALESPNKAELLEVLKRFGEERQP